MYTLDGVLSFQTCHSRTLAIPLRIMEAGEPLARRAIIDLPGHGLGLPGAKPGLASSQLHHHLSRPGNRPDTPHIRYNLADREMLMRNEWQ
jgi:hypothetical protein